MAEMDFSGEHTAPSFEVNHAPPVDDVTNSSDANRQRGGWQTVMAPVGAVHQPSPKNRPIRPRESAWAN